MEKNTELTFTWNILRDNSYLEEVELIGNGSQILITEENKQLFVDKV
jgi:hypothetical protein